MKLKPNAFQPRGFALVVTLSLMILLTVVAVGLLTLSSITLRTTGQGSAMATARANARLALMLAIGELQKAAGPDKAITATSEILAEDPKKPNLTGVWDSWNLDVRSSNLDYESPKVRKSSADSPGFRGWLVSDSDFEETTERSYADSDFAGASIELVGEGSLGAQANPSDRARAGKVVLSREGKKTGAYAWHVADESVKARINTYRNPKANQTLGERRALLGGHRPDVAVMEDRSNTKLSFLPDDVDDYAGAQASTGKMVNLNQAELFDESSTIRGFRNDVTPYSLGLMTNVREGGLKQDLTSLFEMTTSGATGVTGLPSGFSGRKLYQTSVFSNQSAVTGVSDPYWTALAGYYNSYKDLLSPDSNPTWYKAPVENINLGSTVAQPAQYFPAPVIAKVELMFSLLARDKHGPWKDEPGDYMLHLLYTPIVTLHNPYNVNLRFDRMKIGISEVPMGFTFLVNNVKKQRDPLPFSNLFVGEKGKKEFWIEIADWPSASAASPSGPITMKPGQTAIFGPYINATEVFGEGVASYFDYANNKTGTESSPLKAKRGFTGGSYGYDMDWLNNHVLSVKRTDLIGMEFKPLRTPNGLPFRVTASITSKGGTKSYGGMSFNLGTATNIDKLFPDVQRYPKTGGILAQSMYLGNFQNPAGSLKAQTFALFSAYARTTNGGFDINSGSRAKNGGVPNLPDGRLAGIPFLHHNPARSAFASDLTREKPGTQSHEINLLKLDGTADDVISFAADFRTNALTNYKQVNGRSIKSGSYLEIPSGPLQAIADFRRSNALASPNLPAFVQPVGNSYASPLMSTDSVSQTGVASYALLDHSVLANHALYDRTYFSTLAPSGGVAAADRFVEFAEEGKPLPSQLFQAYLPVGKTVEDVKDELFSGTGKPTPSAYKVAAQYQMVKGPFNVNSTRVQAWKAMLASMNRTQMLTLWTKSGAMAETPSKGIPIPAMTLHNGSATDGTFAIANMDDAAANEWNGYREFSEDDIETLAEEIVKQVRLRGPFLSLSEFVNRRIGSDSELTRTGALQNAIDQSRLNDAIYKSQLPVTEADVSDITLYNFKTPLAATGNPAAGAPGWLSQADVLKILEPAVTVRSDTFVIRSYGEATDPAGNVIARCYAEAVMQRMPEYVNPIDPASAKPTNPDLPNNNPDADTPFLTSSENIAFGRRFTMVSFKWLSPHEI
jgi:hypothetical protein